MNLIYELSELMFSLFLFCFGLTSFFLIQFKKNKTKEINKLNYLYLELESEKNFSKKLLKVPKELNKTEKNTLRKFQKVNVAILNIDFSLSEIFSFIP